MLEPPTEPTEEPTDEPTDELPFELFDEQPDEFTDPPGEPTLGKVQPSTGKKYSIKTKEWMCVTSCD